MDQEKIGELIKEIRLKENLSQAKFALKYNVTYQAVSKWETGKSIPDIATLKKICEDYNINLDDLLSAKLKHKKNKILVLIIILIILITSIIILIINRPDNHFEFKKLSTTCDDFKLYGSMAYNNKKTSIYISNISYCGKNDETIYKSFKCTLYKVDDKTKTEINNCSYNGKSKTLKSFLSDVNINVDNYLNTCKTYKENSLYLEIEAYDLNDKITTYKIPLKLESNCK